MEDFFELKAVGEARHLLESLWQPRPLGTEDVPLRECAGRVLAEDVSACENVPPYSRSTVDGYAVRAKDTFGASPSLPSMLQVVYEVMMGKLPPRSLSPGEAARISTGGALPEGADACIMLEHTTFLDDGTLLVEKPVAPGENVILEGEDIRQEQVVLSRGRVLGPYEVGALAAVGRTSVKVVRKPVVAVLSSGDELVPAGASPAPGQIRDINSYSLAASVMWAAGVPVSLGIARDDYADVRKLVEEGLSTADFVVVSGGSSAGSRDVVLKVLSDLGPPGVIVHGVSVRPGKPVILALCKNTPVFGLPGHPVSCLVSFDLFVVPALAYACRMSSGADVPNRDEGGRGRVSEVLPQLNRVKARLARNLSSAPGREDHVRIRLREEGGVLWADPVLGKSGLISVLFNSDGEVVIPPEKEGLSAGEEVVVKLTNPSFLLPYR